MAKKAQLDDGRDIIMNVEMEDDERLSQLNISDSVLCALIYNNASHGEVQLLHRDICFASMLQ